ncbi:MAG TPA: hypothetical protein PKX00_13340 [Opitutaceae bacterium]|nr:hypothetical protein [Opitutaceae bacterium]HRE06591.1 hypothetical protein [Opitutaceae bacterium]
MINYEHSRNRAATVFAVALIVFVPALVVPRSGTDLTFRKLLLFGSLSTLLISGVWLAVRWDEAKRYLRLKAGKGVIARWTIDPARWEWFRRHSQEWDKRDGVRPNDANLEQAPGPAGVEVVVTRDGIAIGNDFSPLEKDVAITVHRDWMQFHQVIPKPRGPALHLVLRLPLAPGSEPLAAEIQKAYRTALAAAPFTRRALLYLGLGILVGMPALTTVIWLIAKATGWLK